MTCDTYVPSGLQLGIYHDILFLLWLGVERDRRLWKTMLLIALGSINLDPHVGLIIRDDVDLRLGI